MIKKLAKYFTLLIVLITIPVIYLSYFGIKTSQFNSIIKNKIKDHNPRLDINLKKVNIYLDLKNISIKLKTIKPVIILDKVKEIELEEISSNISIRSYFAKEFAIKNLKLSTQDNKIKNILNFYKLINNYPQLIIVNQFLKKGNTKFSVYLNFDKNGKIKHNYEIKGKIENLYFGLPKYQSIENLNFEFDIKDKNFIFKNVKFNFDKINFNSDKISIKEENKGYFVEGSLNNSGDKINKNFIQLFYKTELENINLNKSTFNSKSNFLFVISKKFKIKDLNFKSQVNIKEFKFDYESSEIQDFIEEYNNSLKFKNTKINIEKVDDKLSLDGSSDYYINDELTNTVKFNLKKNNDQFFFDTFVDLSSLKLEFKDLDYFKKEGDSSTLIVKGISQDNYILLKEIKFQNLKNIVNVKNLKIENNKIIKLDNLNLNYLNKNNFKNKLSLNSINKDFQLKGESFDANTLINKISNQSNNDNLFNIFKNLNSNIFIDIKEIQLDKNNKVNILKGDLKIKQNEIYSLDISSNFSQNEKLFLKIITNKDKTVITNFYSDRAKPFIKKYKFIKGFEDGHIDFQSTKKNNLTNSKLIIDNFKVQEVPILAKILTLASLQGIADLLTGEGIRFTDFEMLYSKKDNLVTIDEIYCIGPAISIMMQGYIEEDNLISLRGTLVPATTVNRTISSIPLLGNILVGKKVGEGVFGVSFKIKGPPKDLKTSVNPIKTLTPRFITRTLEKIKNN